MAFVHHLEGFVAVVVNPSMPKAFFELLGICSKLNKKPTF